MLKIVIPYFAMFIVSFIGASIACALGIYKRAKHTKKKKIGVMDLVLVIELIAIIVYIVVDFWVFLRVGSEPSTLTMAFFAVCGGENGAMAWIKTRKEQERYRKWQKTDEGKPYEKDDGL